MGALLDTIRVGPAYRSEMIETLWTGSRFHLANLVLYAGAEADKFLVLSFMDDQNVGIHAAALAVSSLGSGFVVQGFSGALYPTISGATTCGEQGNILARNVQASMLLLVLVNGTAAALSPLLVPMLFGVAFEPAVPITVILLLMNTIKGVRQVMDRAMRATGNTRQGILSEGVGLTALLAFASIGASFGGLSGIAWGMVLAQTAALAVMVTGTVSTLEIRAGSLWGLRVANVRRLLAATAREVNTVQGWWQR